MLALRDLSCPRIRRRGGRRNGINLLFAQVEKKPVVAKGLAAMARRERCEAREAEWKMFLLEKLTERFGVAATVLRRRPLLCTAAAALVAPHALIDDDRRFRRRR